MKVSISRRDFWWGWNDTQSLFWNLSRLFHAVKHYLGSRIENYIYRAPKKLQRKIFSQATIKMTHINRYKASYREFNGLFYEDYETSPDYLRDILKKDS